MADEINLTPEEVARQLRLRLESLRAAGIDFLPVSRAPLAVPVVSDPPAPTMLFGEETTPATAAGQSSPDERRQALRLLAEEVSDCMRCKELAATRTQTVFGVGPLDPDLCFIGEAPGHNEDVQGEPFVGPAGQLLNRIITGAGMRREEVFICNVLRCRPPGNRPPKQEEAANCREYLEKTLELVRPRFICTLGLPAARSLLGLGPSVSMGKLRGRFFDYKGVPVLCTYHPSYLLRLEEPEKTAKKRQVWEDMKTLLTRMGRQIPGKA